MNKRFLSGLLGFGMFGFACFAQGVSAAFCYQGTPDKQTTNVYIQNYLYPDATCAAVSPVGYKYPIRNARELNWVSYMVSTQRWTFQGCTIEIVNDIDFSNTEFVPIGTYCTCFQGTINGNGHWIRNLTLNYPGYYGISVVGYLGDYGVVRNLNVASSCRFTGYGNVGGLVACNAGWVEHCSSAAQLFALTDFVGGIAGYNAPKGKVRDCEVCLFSNRSSGAGRKVGLFIGDNYGKKAVHCRTYMFYPW